MTYQKLWDAAKAACHKFMAYLKKQEKSQINNITFHKATIKKEEQSLKLVEGRK